MKGNAAPAGERLIKRYDNRKLYDPAARRYVTLQGLSRLIGKGQEVRVVEQRSGEDITAVVLAQVILEGIKERTARIPRQVLTRLIRLGARPGSAWREWPGPQEAAARAREEAERIVGAWLGRGRLTLEEGLVLRQDITRAVQDIVTEAQKGLEDRLRGLLRGREGRKPHLSLQTLKERLMTFESYLSESRPRPQRRRASASPRRKKRDRKNGKK